MVEQTEVEEEETEEDETEEETEETREEKVKDFIEDMDLSEIETQEEFSGKGSRSGVWNKPKIKSFLKQLKEDTEPGKVRVIPVAFIQENFRNSSKVLQWMSYYCRKQFIDAAKVLDLDIEVTTTGGQPKTTAGSVEIMF